MLLVIHALRQQFKVFAIMPILLLAKGWASGENEKTKAANDQAANVSREILVAGFSSCRVLISSLGCAGS
jgi:hypothetical protein